MAQLQQFDEYYIPEQYGIKLRELERASQQFKKNSEECLLIWNDLQKLTEKLNSTSKKKFRTSLFIDDQNFQHKSAKGLGTKIVVVGCSSSGKTTLINCLLMSTLLPHGFSGPTTQRVTILKEGEKTKLVILTQTGEQVIELPNVSPATLKPYLASENILERQVNRDTAKVYVNHPLLGCGIWFFDVPGHNEANVDHWTTTEKVIGDADICLLCVDASKGVTADDMKCLKAVESKCPRVLVVLTKIDKISAEDDQWQSDNNDNISDSEAQKSKLKRIRDEFLAYGFSEPSILDISLKEVSLARKNKQPLPAEFQKLCNHLTEYIQENWTNTIQEQINELLTACDVILDKAAPEKPEHARLTKKLATEMFTAITADHNKLKPKFAARIQDILEKREIDSSNQITTIAQSTEMKRIPAPQRQKKLLKRLRMIIFNLLKVDMKVDFQMAFFMMVNAIVTTEHSIKDSHSELMFKVAVQALLPKGQDSKNFTFRNLFYRHLLPDFDLESDNNNNAEPPVPETSYKTWMKNIVSSGILLGTGWTKRGTDYSSEAMAELSPMEFAKTYLRDATTHQEFAEIFVEMLLAHTKKLEEKFYDRLKQMEELSHVLPEMESELPFYVAYLKMKLLSIQFTQSGQIADPSTLVLITSGGQGAVYRGKIKGVDVAVKKRQALHQGNPIANCYEAFYEAHILRNLSENFRTQRYFAQFISCWMDNDFFYMAMELMDSNLKLQLPNLSLIKRLNAGYQIAQAMNAMHSFNMAHRDLKPENALVKETNTEFLVKLADTGESKAANFFSLQRTPIGTPGFIAPEYFENNKRGCVDGMKADVYSFGVVMWQLWTGSDLPKNVREGAKPSTPETADTEYAKMMNQCLDTSPKKRPTFAELCSWFSSRYGFTNGKRK